MFRGCVGNHGFAGVAELADAPDLGSGVPDVQVQVLSPAFTERLQGIYFEAFFCKTERKTGWERFEQLQKRK